MLQNIGSGHCSNKQLLHSSVCRRERERLLCLIPGRGRGGTHLSGTEGTQAGSKTAAWVAAMAECAFVACPCAAVPGLISSAWDRNLVYLITRPIFSIAWHTAAIMQEKITRMRGFPQPGTIFACRQAQHICSICIGEHLLCESYYPAIPSATPAS